MPKSKTAQFICTYCRYSTPNAGTMKIHFRTQKHRENKQKNQNIVLDNNEKSNVLKENNERRFLAGYAGF